MLSSSSAGDKDKGWVWGGGLYSAGYGAPSDPQPQLPAYWLSGRKPHSCCDMSILQYWGLSLSLPLLQKIFNSQMHRFCCSPVVLLLFSSSPDSYRRWSQCTIPVMGTIMLLSFLISFLGFSSQLARWHCPVTFPNLKLDLAAASSE